MKSTNLYEGQERIKEQKVFKVVTRKTQRTAIQNKGKKSSKKNKERGKKRVLKVKFRPTLRG